MEMRGIWASALALALAGGWLGGSREAGAADPPAEQAVKVRRGPFKVTLDSDGVFVPAQSSEMSLSPGAYEGELRVAEALPHGSRVHEGDVILRLESEKIEELILAAEWAVRTSERALLEGKVRHGEYDSDAERDLARAEKDLAFAEKGLKGYVEVGRPLEKAEHEANERGYVSSIEDQEEELRQLAKMYKEDELTKETEEIVLKRAKRNLDHSKKNLENFQHRHGYQEEYSEPVQRETLENALKDKTRALRDLKRTKETGKLLGQIEMEKLKHDAGSAKKRLERLRRDKKSFTFRAPHDGILIHGAFDEKLAVAPIHRGSMILPNQPIVTVARHGGLKARFSLKEKDRYRITAGMQAIVIPEALQEKRWSGSLEPIQGFPLPDNTWNANVVFGNEDERLIPLLKCKISVVLADSADALAVPVAAVFRKSDRSICYLRGKSPFGIVARTVITGPDDGKMVIIREGLNEGEEVLLQEP